MTAVAEGRKDEWLALLAEDVVVEDPVGPSLLDPEGNGPPRARGIRRFWDRNFGAVSRFHFLVKDSFANGRVLRQPGDHHHVAGRRRAPP